MDVNRRPSWTIRLFELYDEDAIVHQRLFGLSVLSIWLSLTGCQTAVELHVHNPQPIELEAWVEVSDDLGQVQQTLELGSLAKEDGQTHRQFPVKSGWRYDVHARIPKSATVYHLESVIVPQNSTSPIFQSVQLDPLKATYATRGPAEVTSSSRSNPSNRSNMGKFAYPRRQRRCTTVLGCLARRITS